MNLNLRFYWSLLLRRLPVMLVFLLICSGISLVAALKLPPTYTTSARLSVEAPTITGGAARVEAAGEKLQIIREQLIRRANMLDIATRYNVFEDMHKMSPDEIVLQMRRSSVITWSTGRGQADLMTVGFVARDGRIAADVVNEYVTLVLEFNARRRRDSAVGTLRFFEQEVTRLNEELNQKSAQIVAFKTENACCLPDDAAVRRSRQTLLIERVSRFERDLTTLEKQRADILRIWETTGRLQLGDAPRSDRQRQLDELRAQLEQIKVIYSATNPRVQQLQRRIALLEQSEEISQETEGNSQVQEPALAVALSDIDARKAQVEEELSSTRKTLQELEETLAATPSNAIALDGLQRDLRNTQGLYESAVNSLSAARLGERIEVTDQGQKITVIENASVPSEPSGPDRIKTALMGVLAGGALAAGYFVLLEMLNRAIRRPAEIRNKFGIIPIATIPYMETPRQKLVRRSILVGSLVAVLIGVPAVLWIINEAYMPLDILASKVMRKLGIS